MAIQMSGEQFLPIPRSAVWDGINDADVLRDCIPGCQHLERAGPDTLLATAKIKIGPVAATFKGSVSFSDVVLLESCKLTGEGQGGIAGYAKGAATVTLAEEGDGTRLSYSVESMVGGKIAQLGSRLIQGVSKKYADEFFSNFSKRLVGSAIQPGQPVA